LIRPEQQRRLDGEAERLGGLEVDHQLELRGLLDREVSRLCALEDLIHVTGSLPHHVGEVCPKAHQAACFRPFSGRKNRGKAILYRELGDLRPVAEGDGAGDDKDSADIFLDGHGERSRQIGRGTAEL